MKKNRFCASVAAAVLCALLTGCMGFPTAERRTETDSTAPNASAETAALTEPITEAPTESVTEPTGRYVLEDYDGGVFTMRLPKGWQIETGGAYASYSFRAWDPDDPDIQIFYYGEMGPYFKSSAAKELYQSISTVPGDTNVSLPVMETATLEYCLRSTADYQAAFDAIVGSGFRFAEINELEIESETPITTVLSSIALSESMLKGSLTSTTGGRCTGVFQGTIVDAGSSVINGIDIAPSRAALNVFGIIAPEGSFDEVAEVLTEALTSFRFTDEYIREGINYTDLIGENAMERSRQNMAMMDAVVDNFLLYIRQ